MENPFLQPIADLFGGDPDPMESKQIDPLPEKLYDEIDDLKDAIYTFKKKLFYNRVSNNARQDPGSLNRLNAFHSLFLQIIGYWIGILDDVPVANPAFEGPTREADEKKFKQLTKAIRKLATQNQDARTLVSGLLFQLSTQHPFELGTKISKTYREDAEESDL
jgi:hypothetical protein